VDNYVTNSKVDTFQEALHFLKLTLATQQAKEMLEVVQSILYALQPFLLLIQDYPFLQRLMARLS
jgi:hypothetical protein